MTGGASEGSGRKRVNIDLEQVEKLCGIQCTDEELASFFGVSPRTIERRKTQPAFAEAMARGKAKGRLSLRRRLHELAAKGNVAAAIFLAKNILGYKDYFANELSGPNGDPIAIGPAPELTGLSSEDLKQVIALLNKGEPPHKG